MHATNYPEDLRTPAERLAVAVECAKSNFVTNASHDALIVGDELWLVEDGTMNGGLSLELAGKFGAQA
jgi:hypothetical protein